MQPVGLMVLLPAANSPLIFRELGGVVLAASVIFVARADAESQCYPASKRGVLGL